MGADVDPARRWRHRAGHHRGVSGRTGRPVTGQPPL